MCMCVCVCVCFYPTPLLQTDWDMRSNFKRSEVLIQFSFSWACCPTNVKEPYLVY